MNKPLRIALVLTGLMLASTSCLRKEIDIDPPAFDPQLVVECYLINNRPAELTLSETNNYYAPPELPFFTSGEGINAWVSHNGEIDSFYFDLAVDPITGRVRNFITKKQVRLVEGDLYEILC